MGASPQSDTRTAANFVRRKRWQRTKWRLQNATGTSPSGASVLLRRLIPRARCFLRTDFTDGKKRAGRLLRCRVVAGRLQVHENTIARKRCPPKPTACARRFRDQGGRRRTSRWRRRDRCDHRPVAVADRGRPDNIVPYEGEGTVKKPLSSGLCHSPRFSDRPS